MSSRADVRIFTIREANEAVRELRRTLPAMRKSLRAIEGMEDRLGVLDLICGRAVSADNPDLQEYLALRIRYHRKIAELEGMLRHFEREGWLLRDLDKGVVHFVARRGDEKVLLCWKEGEKSIAHWHALGEELPDESDRQPIVPDEF